MTTTPHPNNASGSYYVVNDCCTLCGVPWHLAPELFSYDDTGCWVSRQPTIRGEEDKMVEVVARQELNCIRYRGRDKRVLSALAASEEARQCDHPRRGPLAALLSLVRRWRG